MKELQEFLSLLEKREVASLRWGITDIGYTWDELEQVTDTFLQDGNYDVSREDLIREMLDRGLLLTFPGREDTDVLRTRMAEGVRLMSELRQLFPYHFPSDGNPEWETAPRLVADYRFVRRPRRYPARDIPADNVLDDLQASPLTISDVQTSVLESLVGDFQLSQFQSDATQEILDGIEDKNQEHGIIIGAGTGTGKTLAFYLPGFMHVAEEVTRKPEPGTRLLALYPRNELLKDQCTSALQQVTTLNRLSHFEDRPLIIGALYGDVPNRASTDELREYRKGWQEVSDGFICPFLRDPEAEEGEDASLIWTHQDIENGRERLFVRSNPNRKYGEDSICLTRERMRETPPDLLLSSTEMLNRSLSDSQNARLYGVGEGATTPELVLLDEAHTYEGTTGAQVAYTLRRWKHAVRYDSKPTFVGLSATLEEPTSFFSDLTGVSEHRTSSIQANPDEAVSQEYMLALRSDPFSGPSTLSTSIQAAMLMGRIMDPIHTKTSGDIFGQRVFLFTDDLDVTNRFYDDLASAEGLMKSGGEYISNPNEDSLAALRTPLREADAKNLFQEGQSWRLAEEVNHDLSRSLLVERVSSQDSGLSSDASLVVATSSLEVGFDDDRVGAVLQHKAPRGAASYLQRKGRAGRKRKMRPWTCVVLSAYGNDQVTYQNYEQLIDPVLDAKSLPLQNRYVLRIQATYACLDWLCRQLTPRFKFVDAWKNLKRPGRTEFQEGLQTAYRELISEILDNPTGEHGRALSKHIREALGITEQEAHVLLWEPPRSIFLGVLPTLHRRLLGEWGVYGAEDSTEQSKAPLPEFMPHVLFGDLNLPEVELKIPSEDDPVLEGVESVLRNYPPGRVNRRHATQGGGQNHWLPISHENSHCVVEVEELESTASEVLGMFEYISGTETRESIKVVRPYGLRLRETPFEIQSQSNSDPEWETQIVAPPVDDLPDSGRFHLPDTSSLAKYVESLAFYTHEMGQPVEVRRFTTGAQARLLVKEHPKGSTVEKNVDVSYERDGEEAALGFLQNVDAVGFVVCMPNVEDLRESAFSDPAQERALRTNYFNHVIEHYAELEEANVFQRGWISRLLVTASVRHARQNDQTLKKACQELDQNNIFSDRLLDELSELSSAYIDPETGDIDYGRHGESLKRLLQNPDFVEEATRYLPVLWKPLGARFDTWLLERFRSTLGAALLKTCGDLTSGGTSDGLILDLDGGASTEGHSTDKDIIWVSEKTLGGSGLIEHITEEIRDAPSHFLQMVRHNLEASDLEEVADEMPHILEELREPGDLTDATERVRAASTNSATQEATEDLRDLLKSKHIRCTHSVFSALAVRLLKSGADRDIERLTIRLYDTWNKIEDDIGVEISPEMVGSLVAKDSDLISLLPENLQNASPDQRSSIFQGLLWSRGSEVRELALRPYHPFEDLPATDRKLVQSDLRDHSERVDVMDEEWREDADRLLQEGGIVELTAPARHEEELADALDSFLFDPVEVGPLHLYPQVDSIQKIDHGYRAIVILDKVFPTT